MNDYDHLTGADIASMIFAAVFLWTVWLLICRHEARDLARARSAHAHDERLRRVGAAQGAAAELRPVHDIRTNLVGWDAGAGEARHQHDERRRRAERDGQAHRRLREDQAAVVHGRTR